MAWIPMYLDAEDIPHLMSILSQEEQLAFISNSNLESISPTLAKSFDITLEDKEIHLVSGGITKHERIKSAEYLLWNREGGELQYRETGQLHMNLPMILTLKVCVGDLRIPMSSLGWIGNHYSILGAEHVATKEMEKFWQRLRRKIKKVAVFIPRENNSVYGNEIYAFPHAYKRIQGGVLCALSV